MPRGRLARAVLQVVAVSVHGGRTFGFEPLAIDAKKL